MPMKAEDAIVSKYYKQFLKDIEIGLDQLDNDLQFVSTIQKYFVKYTIIENTDSMNFAIENSTGMYLDTQKHFKNKNEYSINFYNKGALSYITAKFHKVYKLTDDELKQLQSKQVYLGGTNDSVIVRNNKIMFNKWQFTTDELLKVKDKTIAVIYDLFKDNDFKPQIISQEKPLQFKVFLISKYLTKTFKYHLLYSTVLNDLKRQADCYIAADESGYEVLRGAMAFGFASCTAGIVDKARDQLNKPVHFKVSFVPRDGDDKQTVKDNSGLYNYVIELFHDRGTMIDCDMQFLSNIVDHMDGPFGRTEALNNELTIDLISYLFEKYDDKYTVKFTDTNGLFPLVRQKFGEDEHKVMVERFGQLFTDNCSQYEQDHNLKFTLYATNDPQDDSLIYHLSCQ
jgi:hypothetical protein